MPGYIGWVVQGVGVTQVGLARRLRGDAAELKRAMQAFLVKIAPLFDFRAATAAALVADYPAFRVKRLLRFVFDHLQSDLACNLLLQTRAMRQAAALVYFHRRSVATPVLAR